MEMKRIGGILVGMCCVFVGCSDYITTESARMKLQRALQSPISKSIVISGYETSSAMGADYHESFNVHFQKREFYQLINNLKLERCTGDTTAYCYEISGISDKGIRKTVSITFYRKETMVNYLYVQE